MMEKKAAGIAQQIRDRILELHEIAPDSIGDRLGYQLIESDAQERTFTFLCHTEPWMRNGPGTLHGGMCATVVDQAMGYVAHCVKQGEGNAPTIQMQVTYHRPIIPGDDVLVRVHVVSKTKSLMNLSAEAYRKVRADKICLSANATFFYKPKDT